MVPPIRYSSLAAVCALLLAGCAGAGPAEEFGRRHDPLPTPVPWDYPPRCGEADALRIDPETGEPVLVNEGDPPGCPGP